MINRTLLYIINVDWYFSLHWKDRAIAAQKEGYEVHIAMRCTNRKYQIELEKKGLHIHDIPLERKNTNPIKEIATISSILKTIRRIDPEIIHSATIKPNIYAGLICRLTGKPLIASVTGLGAIFSSGTTNSVKRIIQILTKKTYQLAFMHPKSKILFENRDDLTKMVTENLVSKSQAILIPGAGINTSLFTPKPFPPPSPIIILFASRLLYKKGLVELINATRVLRTNGVNVKLLVAGIIDNDTNGAIPLNKLKLWDNQQLITWLGQVDNMPEIISRSHIVCLPTSYGEGIPRILIEAASCGRPVIASDTPGCREIIKDRQNGLLIDLQSEESLVSGLKILAKDAGLQKKMGTYGRKLAMNTYSSEIVIRKTLTEYSNLLNI